MRTGILRNRVEWKSPVIENITGQPVTTYTSHGTYWAAVEPLSGREGLIAVTARADVTHKVTMRNVGLISPRDQLIFKGRILEISSVLDTNEIGAELILICIEVK